MNMLVVNQSAMDMFASFFTLMTAVIEVDGTRMSHDSVRDQFICRFWLTRLPMWIFLHVSTYCIVILALERYVVVVCAIWCRNNVRVNCVADFTIFQRFTAM